jgi:hypothetical protein
MPKIQIERIAGQAGLRKIKDLIRNYNFKPYYFIKQLKENELNRLFDWQLNKIVAKKGNFILAAKLNNRYRGFIVIEKQEWDSSFFGFNCYKTEHIFAEGNKQEQIAIKKSLVDFMLGICKQKNARYLSAKIDTQDNTGIYAIESSGFRLASQMLQLINITKQKRRHFKIIGKIRSYKKDDLGTLRNIAKNSMHSDHFHNDFHFSKETSDSVYEALIENCCKGVLADRVFVIERNSKVAGYVACKIQDEVNKSLPLRIGYVRHLAVSSSHGFGCGPGLQEAALNWFKDKVDIVESATTVQNLAIIKISIDTNMNIAASSLRFSKWLEE